MPTKLQYTWHGDYCEFVRPAQIPVLTEVWAPSLLEQYPRYVPRRDHAGCNKSTTARKPSSVHIASCWVNLNFPTKLQHQFQSLYHKNYSRYIVYMYVWFMQHKLWGTFNVVRLWGYWKMFGTVCYRANNQLKYCGSLMLSTCPPPHTHTHTHTQTQTHTHTYTQLHTHKHITYCNKHWYISRTEVMVCQLNRELGMQLFSGCYIICHSY